MPINSVIPIFLGFITFAILTAISLEIYTTISVKRMIKKIKK